MKKIVLWFMFICMCIGALAAGFMDIHIVANGKDIMLYHIGGNMIFIIFAIGIIIELNIFHVREHFPLVLDLSGIDWIVIGTETRKRKGKADSKREWVFREEKQIVKKPDQS